MKAQELTHTNTSTKAPRTYDDLRAYAKTFPSQGGVEIGPWLEQYAARLPAEAAIVEVGCWLGAGTAHLALGAMQSHAAIYTHDRFMCVGEEKEKAGRFGVRLRGAQDTLPTVKAWLKPFPVEIIYQKMSLRDLRWEGGPIGLYVDDATKVEPLWLNAMGVFRRSFIPYRTHLFLMDYHFDEKAGEKYGAQKRYMAAHGDSFELIEDRLAGTTCALFRYLG